jgi:hypothetical protein
MKSKDDAKKIEPRKETTLNRVGQRYLDWWLGHEKPPSYKNIADNLRAYLTIGAYIVLIRYLWFWGDDRIPGWVFQVAAVMWGTWVIWFAVLTFIQTWYLFVGFCFELLGLIVSPYFKSRKGSHDITNTERNVIEFLVLLFGCSSMVMVGTAFYLIGAILRSAKVI